MSTTDARGHVVPEGTDPAARQSLLDLSLSIPSLATAGSEQAANQHVQALINSGATVDENHPVHVWRSDLNAIMTWTGSAWMWPSGNTHTNNRLVSPAVPTGPWDAFAGRTIDHHPLSATGAGFRADPGPPIRQRRRGSANRNVRGYYQIP